MTEKDEIIKTTDLCKTFDKSPALESLNISIKSGSITGLVGRNGSGKTTLLKIIAGRLDKTSGEALVFGTAPMDNIDVQNKLIYTYHNVEYEQNQTLDTILYAFSKMFPNFDTEFAEKLMSYFELSGRKKYKGLSQGMSSTFNFISAIAARAELTLLDEPVLGMDVTVRRSVYEILLRDFSEHPRTLIISSHLLSEIEGVLTDILLIEKGKLVLHCPIDDIRQAAYRVDGSAEAVEAYIADKKVLAKKTTELSNYAITYEPLSPQAEQEAAQKGLTISSVRAEDLCVYLTHQNKEDELKCLW